MSKIVKCKTCGAEIAKTANRCPNCGAQQHIAALTAVYLISFATIAGVLYIIFSKF